MTERIRERKRQKYYKNIRRIPARLFKLLIAKGSEIMVMSDMR